MNWNEIQHRWPELKARIHEEHPDVRTEELERTSEGRRQLLQLIEAQYGTSKPAAEGDVDRLVEGKDDGETS